MQTVCTQWPFDCGWGVAAGLAVQLQPNLFRNVENEFFKMKNITEQRPEWPGCRSLQGRQRKSQSQPSAISAEAKQMQGFPLPQGRISAETETAVWPGGAQPGFAGLPFFAGQQALIVEIADHLRFVSAWQLQ